MDSTATVHGAYMTGQAAAKQILTDMGEGSGAGSSIIPSLAHLAVAAMAAVATLALVWSM